MRLVIRTRTLLFAAALALGGCHGPDPAPGDQPGETAPRIDPRQVTDDELQRGWAVIHYDAMVRRANAALDTPDDGVLRSFVEWGIARGDRLELYFLVVRGIAPPSRVEKDEVLVIIEGRGVLEVNGRAREVMPGALCTLPAGARGNLEASAPNAPLYALLVRSREPAVTPPPRASFGDIAQVQLAPAERAAGPRVTPVAGFPSRLGLHALAMAANTSWGAEGSPHDLVLFLIDGEGNLGVGNAGGRVAQGSVAIMPAGTSWYAMTTTDETMSALVFAAPQLPELLPEESTASEGPR
jgi:mannose-6-phosphate isomerase-like protein (cupin superfamily)